MRLSVRAILCLCLLAASACPARDDGKLTQAPARASNGSTPSAGPSAGKPEAKAESAQVVLMPPGRDPITVRVEIADEEAERQRGLMFREQLAPDAGMLFLFETPQHLTFWMRNTYLPLDMIFIEPSKTILGVVENAEPRTDVTRSVPGISQYVLEVNAGFSREHGLTPGTVVRFVGLEGAAAASSSAPALRGGAH
jgi:uncharacterized protein